MPRIAATTIKEHNEQVLAALVDAAEDLLRKEPRAPLTAGAVAAQAGIARNSIYRHVASVDDLRGLVIQRHLTPWAAALDEALAGVDDPRERVRTWARVNLAQAAAEGHGWLAQLAFGSGLDVGRAVDRGPAAAVPVPASPACPVTGGQTLASGAGAGDAHRRLEGTIASDLTRLVGAAGVELHLALLRGLVDAGMRRVDAGDEPEAVTGAVDAALCGLLEARPAAGATGRG